MNSSIGIRPIGNHIKINVGMALLRLAQTYPTIFQVILELVQNSLDKDVQADRIWIVVNCQHRFVTVRDNGRGTSIERFNRALESVATPNRKGGDSLGQFGLGLISPLGKCEKFTFISCVAPATGPFQEWTFDCKQIQSSSDAPPFALRPRNDLTLDTQPRRGQTPVKWRSEVKLHEFTKDATVSALDVNRLVSEIQSRYGITMRRNKAVISLTVFDQDGRKKEYPDITAPQYSGRPLPEINLQVKDAGTVTFRLYEAVKTAKGRDGQVLVGVTADSFRFPFHYFGRSTDGYLAKEVIDALKSGLFEGEIVCDKVKLHPNRNTFERNDAFLGLCIAIEDWFNRTGKYLVEETRSQQRERRWQELGLRSLAVLKSIFENPAHAHLRDAFKAFGNGTIGSGHTDLPKKQIVGEQSTTSVSSDGSPGVTRERSEEPSSTKEPKKPTGEQDSHSPFTVSGPQGRVRKVVKNSSFGLQFSYEGFVKDPGKLWRLEMEQGILVFNSLHPHWVACSEKSDAALMQLQEVVGMEVLALLVNPESIRDYQRTFSDTLNPFIVSWILEGDKLRKPKGSSV